MERWFERTTAHLTDEQKADLKRKMSRAEEVSQVDQRIHLPEVFFAGVGQVDQVGPLLVLGAGHRAGVQHAQQLHLHRGGELTDFVEQQRTLLSELEQSALASAGAGEGPGLVTEQLGLSQLARQSLKGKAISLITGRWNGGMPGVWWWRRMDKSGGQIVEPDGEISVNNANAAEALEIASQFLAGLEAIHEAGCQLRRLIDRLCA